jgi:hypothetical protein
MISGRAGIEEKRTSVDELNSLAESIFNWKERLRHRAYQRGRIMFIRTTGLCDNWTVSGRQRKLVCTGTLVGEPLMKKMSRFAVIIAVLSCVWMFGAMAKFAITGMLFGITPANWMLAVWLIFASGLAGLGLASIVYQYSKQVSSQTSADVDAGKRTGSG